MKKKYSIKKNEDIQRILQTGRFYKNRELILYIKKNNTSKNYVAFLVGKKLGTAPQRNQIKRRLRAALHPIWEDIEPGYDIVIMARPMILGEKTQKVQMSLENLLKRHRIVVLEKH